MATLAVVARLKAKSGREENLAAPCRSLVAPTRAETGCLTYDLHRSHDDPGLFMSTESWKSRPLSGEPMTSPHLVAFGEKQDAVVETGDLFTGEKA